MSCKVEGCNQFNFHYNPLISPLLNFHGKIATLGDRLPSEGKAAEVAQRIGLAVLSPFIYLALAFAALVGLIPNGIWETKHVSESVVKNQDSMAQFAEHIGVFGTKKTIAEGEKPIPESAFGKAEWEKNFPVKIAEVPPLPANIDAILDLKDPYEPDKKLKETCMLFLRPKEVILQEEGVDKKLLLGFDGVEELAQKATNPALRTHYQTILEFRSQMNALPVADSAWVLMRKEVIPGSGKKSFETQKSLLKGRFEVPKIMDAILLNLLAFASEGKCLFGTNPMTYTRCQEKYMDCQTVVGGFDPSGLPVYSYNLDHPAYGLAGTWMF